MIAFAFAWVARKANLFFLAIATLALSEIINQVISQWNQFTGRRRRGAPRRQADRALRLDGDVAGGAASATNERNLFWVYLGALAVAVL